MPACRGPGGEELRPVVDSNDRRLLYPGAWPGIDPSVRDFDEVAEVTLTKSATDFVPIVQWPCPRGNVGVGMWFGQDVETSTAYQNVRWRIRVGDTIWLVYPAIIQVAGFTQSLLTSICPFVPEGQVLTLDGLNISSTTDFKVRGRLKGRYRPLSSAGPQG